MKHLMVSVEDLRNVQRIFDCRLKDARRRQEACLYRNEIDSAMIVGAEADAYSEAWTYMEKLIRMAEYEEMTELEPFHDSHDFDPDFAF